MAAKHKQFEVARMTLETLINTYPDSDYASKAKPMLEDLRNSECEAKTGLPQNCEDAEPFNQVITFNSP